MDNINLEKELAFLSKLSAADVSPKPYLENEKKLHFPPNYVCEVYSTVSDDIDGMKFTVKRTEEDKLAPIVIAKVFPSDYKNVAPERTLAALHLLKSWIEKEIERLEK